MPRRPHKPAITPVALAAADSSLERQSASMQMLLLTMAGALALAGITASLIFRFGRANAPPPGNSKRPARALGSCPHRTFVARDIPDEDMPIRRVHMPRLPAIRARPTIRSGGSRKCWRGWRAAPKT